MKIWVVVWNIFCFHPYWGKITQLTNIFQMGWFNRQLEIDVCTAVTCGDGWQLFELLLAQVQRDLQALSEIDEQLGGGECGGMPVCMDKSRRR